MNRFLKKHWGKIALAVIGIPVVGYFVLCLSIGVGVRNAVSDAQSRFPGDPAGALIAVATSDEASLKDRNRAIWALGQRGSPEALPILQTLETSEKCDHETSICQHEVDQAIEGCSGVPNIGAWVWRHGKLAASDE